MSHENLSSYAFMHVTFFIFADLNTNAFQINCGLSMIMQASLLPSKDTLARKRKKWKG